MNSTIILDEMTLRKELRDTTNSRRLMEQLGMPPLTDVTEFQEILRITEKGEALSPYQLERVKGILLVIERLKNYLSRGKMDQNPIAFYEENLIEKEDLKEIIELQIRNDRVDDHASKALYEIRMAMLRCEEEMKAKAEQIMRRNKEAMADTFVTLRNGRICVPVKKEYKHKISGSVIDKSSTGNTLFMEPVSVANLYEDLALLRIQEENEVYQILYTLSAMVCEAIDDLTEDYHLMEKLDYMFSKGKLSMDLHCCEPILGTDRKIMLKQARHPLMDPKVNVPLDFSLGDSYRGVIITGPNTGGKTVAIKTVMLNCYMAQCGLHVPCEAAEICMNSSYLCDIGDGQNIQENLSTFSAHIRNVLKVLSEVNEDSFVIMDELGSGTDPAEGMGIAIAILEELRKSGANFLVTTHYPEVKNYASDTEGMVNARMTFDRTTLSPTYHMIIGEAGESCAFFIADKLGMPAHMLECAVTAAYGKDAISNYKFHNAKEKHSQSHLGSAIRKTAKVHSTADIMDKFAIGDSVTIFPDKKIGIVYEPVNEKGVLRVQIAGRKIWINQKRVKLKVKAAELYPEDYDFSIIFDSVETRKKRHDMNRKYTEDILYHEEDDN